MSLTPPVFTVGLDPLDSVTVAEHVARPFQVRLADGIRGRLIECSRTASDVSSGQAAYGRTTGVGANRDTGADDGDGDHGVRLLRSHAAGTGPLRPEEVGRALILARAHQLAIPGSGVPVEVVDALVAAASAGVSVPVREWGGLGTGDITVLAELGLCLVGERPWSDGSVRPFLQHIGADGALALMSSSAPTVAEASLAVAQLDTMLQRSVLVLAASLRAVGANAQQWSVAAAEARRSAGVSLVAARLREVFGAELWLARRTQDPVSFRSAPWVLGPVFDAVAALRAELDSCIDGAYENPLYREGGVWHHGAFHLTGLALHLDTVRLALAQWLATSVSRLAQLHDPQITGLSRFLATGPDGASGLMVAEYSAAGALRSAQHLADPVSRASVTISLGTEEHTSYAWTAAVALGHMLSPASTVLGAELLSASQALQLLGVALPEALVELVTASPNWGRQLADRVLVEELAAAADLVMRSPRRSGL